MPKVGSNHIFLYKSGWILLIKQVKTINCDFNRMEIYLRGKERN